MINIVIFFIPHKAAEVHLRFNVNMGIYTVYTSDFEFTEDFDADDPDGWMNALKAFRAQETRIKRS